MGVMDLFSLKGQVALVTGGARGLGRQIAEGLAEAGADLVIASRKLENLEQAAIDLEKVGVRVLPVKCDVTESDQIQHLVEKTVAEFGRLDILVNNAGITWGAPVEEYPLEQWRRVLEANVTGVFLACQEAARIMIPQGRGKIINLTSVMGFTGGEPGVVDATAYSVSKGAIVSLTRDLAVKWAEKNINVNAIAPSWFPTRMTEWMIENRGEKLLARIPMRRFGGSEDLKGAVVFLASAASDYVTGITLPVDGGYLAG